MAVLGQSPDRHLIYNCAPPTVAKAGCLGKKITAGGACTASPLHHLYLKLSRSDVFVFSNTNIFSSLSLSCLPLNSCQLLYPQDSAAKHSPSVYVVGNKPNQKPFCFKSTGFIPASFGRGKDRLIAMLPFYIRSLSSLASRWFSFATSTSFIAKTNIFRIT